MLNAKNDRLNFAGAISSAIEYKIK